MKKLTEQQLKAMSNLRGSEIETILQQEYEINHRLLEMSHDEIHTRWLQGKQQLLFEMMEIITTARTELNKPMKPEYIPNAF